MRLLTVNVVEELIPGPKETGFTAIDKRPQSGRVRVLLPHGEDRLERGAVTDSVGPRAKGGLGEVSPRHRRLWLRFDHLGD